MNLLDLFLKSKLFKQIDLKFFCIIICFFVFLYTISLCLPINRVSAAAILEVSYPTVSGQTITAEIALPDYVKYLFNAGVFLGFFAVFISLLIAGVMYILSPAKPDLLADAKDRVSGAISGLLILVLTYLIITTINPQLSIFTTNQLPSTSISPAETKSPGVYFYKSAGCSDNDAQPHTSSIPDLGPLKNGVNSVGIIQNLNTQTSYITILYDNINFWGKCQYITTSDPASPDQTCQNVTPFATSASVHVYDYNPYWEGVFFFRKSCFNAFGQNSYDTTGLINYCKQNSGGYYEVTNDEIKNAGVYLYELNNTNNPLKFTGDSSSSDCTVPEEEQDCIKYDDKGKCTQKECPTLGGENISSMIIDGNYLVLLVYFNPNDPAVTTGIWNSCQEFPIIEDVNKKGPQQIKWQNIRNNGNVIPNYVVIIPIKK